MHDLAFVGFLAALIAAGFRKPFLFILVYVYIDVVSPQRLSYFLLNAVPISLIAVVLAVAGWAVADDKRDVRLAPRQFLILLLLDRKSVVSGKSVSVRVDLGGRRFIKTKNN